MELAKQYIEETEAFDRTVCTGKSRNGMAIPDNGYQQSIISRDALKVRDRYLFEVREMGLTIEDWRQAIRMVE
jgi:hypothetical protein